MKRLLTLLFGLILLNNGHAQQDTALINRLNQVLQFTQAMDLEKVLDYTYPKLFAIASREQMMEVLKNTFESEEFSTTLDSINVDTIFPVFTIKDESYSKIKHSMLMRMKFKEPLDTPGQTSDRESMASMMEQQFGEGNVRYDKSLDALVILLHPVIIGIKIKENAKWYFVNFDEDNDLFLNMLFSKEVLEKLKEYN